jgi:hypothetical protein
VVAHLDGERPRDKEEGISSHALIITIQVLNIGMTLEETFKTLSALSVVGIVIEPYPPASHPKTPPGSPSGPSYIERQLSDEDEFSVTVTVKEEDKARINGIVDWFASNECCFNAHPQPISACGLQESRISPQPCGSKKIKFYGIRCFHYNTQLLISKRSVFKPNHTA